MKAPVMLLKVNAAMDFVERLCEPDQMTKPEAVEYLSQIIDRCRSSVEALEEEMEC